MQKYFKPAAKIFSTVVGIITFLVILFTLTYSILLPYVFHQQPYVVLSSSMEPSIPVGSIVSIDFHDRDPEVGDVITYRMDDGSIIELGDGNISNIKKGILVTHRVVEIDEDCYYTKGDNNDQRDFLPVYSYQIIGTYRWRIPQLGYLLTAISEMKMRIFIIGIIIMLNIAAMMFNIAVEDDEEEKKEEQKEAKTPEQEAVPNASEEGQTTPDENQELKEENEEIKVTDENLKEDSLTGDAENISADADETARTEVPSAE